MAWDRARPLHHPLFCSAQPPDRPSGGGGPSSASEDDEPTIAVPPPVPPSTSYASVHRLPTRIGGYAIVRRIGEGGMGVVYEAIQDKPRRTVALKVMRDVVASEDMVRRFELEAEVLGRLQHPNIARVFDAGIATAFYSEDGSSGPPVPYFAMEYVTDARPLDAHAREAGLGTPERLELLAIVCDAAHHAHERGVLHRDISPSNVLADRDGWPRIIDYGLARVLDAEAWQETRRTLTGAIVGKLEYMSPEQIAGRHDLLDARADVYALGVLGYAMLCGRLPHRRSGTALDRLVATVREETPVRPRRLNPDLPAEADAVLLKAVEPNLANRYASAAEFAEELRALARGGPVSAAGRNAPLLRLARTARRVGSARRVLTAAAVAVGMTALMRFGGMQAMQAMRWPLEIGQAALMVAVPRSLSPLPPEAPYQTARLVLLEDIRPETLAELLENAGRPAPSGKPPDTREVYAALVDKLAACGARVIAFDINFSDRDPAATTALAEAITRARAAGVPVVLGSATWAGTAALPEGCSPALIAAATAWGGISIEQASPWQLHLAVQRRGEAAKPSLALLAAELMLEPAATVAVELRESVDRVRVRATDELGRPLGERARRASVTVAGGSAALVGLGEQDAVALRSVILPGDEALAASELSVRSVLTRPPGTVRGDIGGRCVVVANSSNGRDRALHPDGRTLLKAHVHPAAIDSLLRGPVHQLPDNTEMTWAVLAASGLGAGSAAAVRRRRPRLLAGWAAPAAVAGGGIVLLFAVAGVAVHPVPVLCAALLSWVVAALLIGEPQVLLRPVTALAGGTRVARGSHG